MTKVKTNWSKEELKAYLLLYCANANQVISPEESRFIEGQLSLESFESIKSEFEADNDYQSIQKIAGSIDRFGYSEGDIAQLMNEVKALFLADGKFDHLEKSMSMALKRLFT